jgi:hypothetical protein
MTLMVPFGLMFDPLAAATLGAMAVVEMTAESVMTAARHREFHPRVRTLIRAMNPPFVDDAKHSTSVG